jgi:hypothetical protein
VKVENIDTPKGTFTPVSFSITIESEEELMALWHRTNMGRFARDYKKEYHLTAEDENMDATSPLWEKLNDIKESL